MADSKIHEYTAGEYLFREGAPSRAVYRLVTGKGEILRRTKAGLERIGLFHPDEFVGEMGVLIATPRNATARFLTNSVVAEFTRADFLKMVRKEAGLDLKVLNALSLRTRAQLELLARTPNATDRHPRGSCLERVNRFIRARLHALPFVKKTAALFPASKFAKLEFAQGQCLFKEGDHSDQVFWIASGKVRLERNTTNAGPRMGLISTNEFLGEMGVLESAPRSATAIADSVVSAYAIAPSEFFRLMKASAPAYFTVLETLCERARRLNRLITEANREAHGGSADLFQTASSIDSMTQLAEARFLGEAEKVRLFLATQKDRGHYVAGAYQKYMHGTATPAEMEKANTYLRDYLKMAGIGTLFLLPGGVITVPLAAKIGKALGVDIFPSADEDKADG